MTPCSSFVTTPGSYVTAIERFSSRRWELSPGRVYCLYSLPIRHQISEHYMPFLPIRIFSLGFHSDATILIVLFSHDSSCDAFVVGIILHFRAGDCKQSASGCQVCQW
jgi:hypothetical protein